MKAPLIGLGLSAVCLLLSGMLCGNSHSTSDSMVGLGLLFLGLGVIGAGVCFIWLLVALIRGKS